MVKTCSARNAQQEFPSLLGRVRRKKDTVIVEEEGCPVVAMIPSIGTKPGEPSNLILSPVLPF